jgi:hypothetical protein
LWSPAVSYRLFHSLPPPVAQCVGHLFEQAVLQVVDNINKIFRTHKNRILSKDYLVILVVAAGFSKLFQATQLESVAKCLKLRHQHVNGLCMLMSPLSLSLSFLRHHSPQVSNLDKTPHFSISRRMSFFPQPAVTMPGLESLEDPAFSTRASLSAPGSICILMFSLAYISPSFPCLPISPGHQALESNSTRTSHTHQKRRERRPTKLFSSLPSM